MLGKDRSVCVKDYERDRDDQGFFCCRQLAELRIVQGIHLYDTLLLPFCYHQTDACFHGWGNGGWWVTVDFDSQYKILWGETRAHGVPIHEKNKVQNKNMQNYIFLSPII